jgi:hypothetical protein
MVGTSFGLSSFVLRRPLSEGLARTLTEGWTQRESLSSVDPLRSDIDGQRARGSRAWHRASVRLHHRVGVRTPSLTPLIIRSTQH